MQDEITDENTEHATPCGQKSCRHQPHTHSGSKQTAIYNPKQNTASKCTETRNKQATARHLANTHPSIQATSPRKSQQAP